MGDDQMSGGAGDDVIAGGRGADRLAGDAGDNQLAGGRGQDSFVITDPGTGFDRIADFATGAEGDRLAFAADVLDGFDPASSEVADFFGLDADPEGTLFRVDPDGGGDDFVAVALLQGVGGVALGDLVVNPDQSLSIGA
jgi:Ca2+-binding RTX toxin-like protein